MKAIPIPPSVVVKAQRAQGAPSRSGTTAARGRRVGARWRRCEHEDGVDANGWQRRHRRRHWAGQLVGWSKLHKGKQDSATVQYAYTNKVQAGSLRGDVPPSQQFSMADVAARLQPYCIPPHIRSKVLCCEERFNFTSYDSLALTFTPLVQLDTNVSTCAVTMSYPLFCKAVNFWTKIFCGGERALLTSFIFLEESCVRL